jgi:hypothetical protein
MHSAPASSAGLCTFHVLLQACIIHVKLPVHVQQLVSERAALSRGQGLGLLTRTNHTQLAARVAALCECVCATLSLGAAVGVIVWNAAHTGPGGQWCCQPAYCCMPHAWLIMRYPRPPGQGYMLAQGHMSRQEDCCHAHELPCIRGLDIRRAALPGAARVMRHTAVLAT